jgi:hypothetical protein
MDRLADEPTPADSDTWVPQRVVRSHTALVAGLRDRSHCWCASETPFVQRGCEPCGLRAEAADQLERLAAAKVDTEEQLARIWSLTNGVTVPDEAVGGMFSAMVGDHSPETLAAAVIARIEAYEAEEAEASVHAERQAELLHGIAVAIHGGPLENGLWSWHDLPELVQQTVAERDRLRAFATSVTGLVDERHHPWPGSIEIDGELRSTLVCHGCRTAERNLPWPCPTHLTVHPDPVMPTAEEVIGINHMSHSRMCNCLDHSGECCDLRCGCHQEQADG